MFQPKKNTAQLNPKLPCDSLQTAGLQASASRITLVLSTPLVLLSTKLRHVKPIRHKQTTKGLNTSWVHAVKIRWTSMKHSFRDGFQARIIIIAWRRIKIMALDLFTKQSFPKTTGGLAWLSTKKSQGVGVFSKTPITTTENPWGNVDNQKTQIKSLQSWMIQARDGSLKVYTPQNLR